MAETTSALWSSLQTLSGTAALTFIVAIALGLAALAVLYLASAIVVLERFARMARSPFAIGLFAAVAALLAAAAGPELLGVREVAVAPSFAASLLRAAISVAIAIGLSALALHALSPERLATIVLVVLGLATAALAGASGNVAAAAAPSGLMALFAAVLAFRRARQIPGPVAPGAVELRVRWLCGLLALGIPGAFLLPASDAGGVSAALASAGTTAIGLAMAGVLLGLLPLAAAGLVALVRSVEWFIAVRYLVAKRRQVFISAISAICVGGIAAGVWLIIVVLSVMNGFERTWRDEILGNRAHLTVQRPDGPFGDYAGIVEKLRDVPGVVGASPYLDAEGLVRSDTGEVYSVRVRGIDPDRIGSVTDLPSDLIMGSLAPLGAAPIAPAVGAEGDPGPDVEPDEPGIVLGNQLALAIGVGIGDPVLLVTPFGGRPTPLGPSPRLMRFRVVGIFQSSFFQYDEVYTYVSLPSVQRFRSARDPADVIDAIEVRTSDFYRSRAIGEEIEVALGDGFTTRDWKEFFPAFFQALKTERVMMFVLLTMVMVVATFLIFATLVMMIMEKSNDIAILKAMGARDRAIERIFAIEGTLIGLVGTALGVVAGVAVSNQLSWIQDTIESLTGVDALPSSVYQFSSLPSEIDPVQIGVVAAIGLVLSLGATLLPSHQGSRLEPAEGLRYE